MAIPFKSTPATTIPAYLSVPPSNSGIGLLLCHAWWGLNETFKQICDRFAQEGFVVLAPDLFHGEVAETIEAAEVARGYVDRKVAKLEIRAALDYLVEHTAVSQPHIGAVGFSYGCGYTLEAARMRPGNVRAVTLFYGTGGGNFEKTTADFQGHFAEHDAWAAHEQKVQSLQQRIERAKRTASFYTYPGTEHWFFEENRPEYNEAAANQAWERTIAFLKEKLLSE